MPSRTVHYLNARTVGDRMAAETTESILSVFGVAAVDERVLRHALDLRWPDFEDAVTAAAASQAQCDALVTRHPADFKRSPVRVLTPVEARGLVAHQQVASAQRLASRITAAALKPPSRLRADELR